ncbi:casein kinase I-like [Homarus americanus]|uniref:Serine/threonine-protein kinase 35-like n=1 Tax=Homarus americanus TaxID=6706 RepID=A0A8J5MMA8_HOMAM|nr:casein kinase I-like [Homarus americanus]KAG7156500.1 Serine/threonine-protein kinase 35-like [Homarus americanus]
MVLKRHKKVTYEKFIEEHSFHVALDGAGGAPRVRAVCVEERAMIMDYTGMSYDQYLRRCSPREQFHSLLKVAEALSALHLKNVIHNDLKENNITITFPEGKPVLHIIDYGLATKSGVTVNHGQHRKGWMAPELYTGGFTSPASDTYSFGKLVYGVARRLPETPTKNCLNEVVAMTIIGVPLRRPLAEVISHMYAFLPQAN